MTGAPLSPGAGLDDLRVVHFTDDRVADPRAACREMPWQEYHAARNAVVRACRRHGSVGPMGECPITSDPDPPHDWPVGDDDPAFFIVDDQLNHERYLYGETPAAAVLTPAWLADLAAALATVPGWGVGFDDVPGGYVLVFATHLLVKGLPFAAATTAADVLRAWRGAMEGG